MSDENFCLKDYMGTVVNYRKWLLLSIFIPAISAAVFSFFLPNKYMAKAIVYITSPKIKTELAPESVAILQSGQPFSRISTSFDPVASSEKACELMLKGQDTLQDVIKRLKLEDITIEELDKMLKVERVEESKSYYLVKFSPALLLTVVVKKDKALTSRIANTWAQIFVEKYNAITKDELEEIYRFILGEYEKSKLNLKDAEKALLEFESSAKSSESIEQRLEYLSLKRDVQAATDAYNMLGQKLNHAKISVVERSSRAIIAAKAVEPQKKIGPPRLLISLCAAGAGLLFFLSLCFIIPAKDVAKA